jgi:hypothetical protein
MRNYFDYSQFAIQPRPGKAKAHGGVLLLLGG